MRPLLAVVVLSVLLPGCSGPHAPPGPLPHDFSVTQPAAAGVAIDAAYLLNVSADARLVATLVWGTPGNQLGLDLTAGGSSGQQGAVDGMVARLNLTLSPATYQLRVTGTPGAADVWHLEVHFTRP